MKMQYENVFSLIHDSNQQKNSNSKVICPDCNKDFIHPRNLHQHQRSAHQGKRYYCQDCTNSYTRQYNLTHHRLKAHPEKIPPPEVRFLKNKPQYHHLYNNSASNNAHTSTTTNNSSTYVQNRAFPQKCGLLVRRRKPQFVRRIHPASLSHSSAKASPLALNAVVQNGDQSSMEDRQFGDPPTSTASPATSQATAHVLAAAGSPIEITHQMLGLSKTNSNSAILAAESKKYGCIFCPFVTENTAGLRKHVEKHGIQIFGENLCKFCDYAGSNFTGLLQHAPTHFEPLANRICVTEDCAVPLNTPLTCAYCDRKFETADEIEAHENLHEAC